MRQSLNFCLIALAVVLASCSRGGTPPESQGTSQTLATEHRPPASLDSEELNALQLFKRRITPILQAENSSSCSECHLSGVDLKQYIGPDQAATFASLRAAGLIDLENPDASKILAFINRRPEKPSLLTDKVRQEEYTAFRAWIHAAAKDPELTAANTSDSALGPTVPDEVIRHARKDRVLASFIDHVWSEVGRCAACHSPDRNQAQVKEHGEQVSWIKLQDPQATLDYMLEAELFDLTTPSESLLLLKPTMQVEHGGGQKLMVGDRTYKQFRRFIEDYAAVAKGTYQTTDALPGASKEIAQASDIWLKLTNVPTRFDKQLLQIDLYRWDQDSDRWSRDRWATADRAVAGDRNRWQQHISITAPRASERATLIRGEPRLPPGKYLAKIYIDQTDKLKTQFPTELTHDDFVGQVEIESSWQSGYGRMTAAEFP
ncbi:MAG TPA: hypothetical protein VMM76_12545 [Pirellulaceae bacterium]|nr:hypothetical protein [Pirellulaceae bacterium]